MDRNVDVVAFALPVPLCTGVTSSERLLPAPLNTHADAGIKLGRELTADNLRFAAGVSESLTVNVTFRLVFISMT